MDINNKLILTVEDISKILKIGKIKAYELTKTPGFPRIKIGRQIRIPYEEFSIWIKAQCNN